MIPKFQLRCLLHEISVSYIYATNCRKQVLIMLKKSVQPFVYKNFLKTIRQDTCTVVQWYQVSAKGLHVTAAGGDNTEAISLHHE